jgi:hypothetical protein
VFENKEVIEFEILSANDFLQINISVLRCGTLNSHLLSSLVTHLLTNASSLISSAFVCLPVVISF